MFQILRNQIECLEATSQCLVEKLYQTEALVNTLLPLSFVNTKYLCVQVVKGTGSTSSATRNVYEQVPSAESRKRSKGQVCHSSENVKFSIMVCM